MDGLDFVSVLKYPITIPIENMMMKLLNEKLEFEIDEDNKLVVYELDHEYYMRLSFFLYLQEIDLIKVTLAQNIQICLELIDKWKQMQQQKISHNYLSMDRIWFKFSDERITVMPSLLEYHIYFVGYDCPFYEKSNYQNSQIDDEKSIKEIIENIISHQRLYKKIENANKAKNLRIFEQLIEKGIQLGFEAFIKQSQQIFKEYNNEDNNSQILVGIDSELLNFKLYNLFKRVNRIKDILENLKILQKENLKKQNSQEIKYEILRYQMILHHTLPSIAKELNDTIFYSYKRPSAAITKSEKQQAQKQIIEQIKEISSTQLINIINEQISSINKMYKLEFDVQQITKEIKNLLQKKVFEKLEYYFNDYSFYNDPQSLILANEIWKEEITQQLVKDYFYLKVQHELCQLNFEII